MNEHARKQLIELIYDAEDALTLGYRRHRPIPDPAQAPRGPVSRVSDAASLIPESAASHAGVPRVRAGELSDTTSLTTDAPAERPPVPETREGREAALRELEQQVLVCTKCPLNEGRTNAVPGMGVVDPLVMVIGEGPGAQEDARGEPFVGRAGQYLDKWLNAIQLFRDRNVYITNIVKCRPPGNRDPQPGESAACNPYLERQIDLIRPRAILAVGRISSSLLTGRTEGIGRIRGRVYTYRGIPLVPTYHPSGVLRNDQWRRPVWEDLKLLKSILDDADGPHATAPDEG